MLAKIGYSQYIFNSLTTAINPFYLYLSAVIHSTLQFDSEAFSSTLYTRHLNRDLSPISEGHHRF